MTLGEIKIEALRIMFANNEILSVESIDEYKTDDTYKDYLDRMNGSINRAIRRMETRKLIPTKTKILTLEQGTVKGLNIRFNLAATIPDYGSIDRIIYENDLGCYEPFTGFKTEGFGLIVLPALKDATEWYTVIYNPILEPYNSATDETETIPLPNSLAAAIPYFVKADLYEEDEPELAATARNIFESQLDEYQLYAKEPATIQTNVKNVLF